jgi:hypothetical protein
MCLNDLQFYLEDKSDLLNEILFLAWRTLIRNSGDTRISRARSFDGRNVRTGK